MGWKNNEWEWNPNNTAEKMDCSKAYTALRDCFRFGYQLHHYYQEGTLDDCRKQYRGWTACARVKLMTPADAEEYLNTHFPRQETGTPVWEPRQSPPAQWAE